MNLTLEQNGALEIIEHMAGNLRRESFKAVALFAFEHRCKYFVETGCFRGGTGDGCSTLVFAALATSNNGYLDSCDSNQRHIEAARGLIKGYSEITCMFHCDDSVVFLSRRREPIHILYLDSADVDQNNPGPCQRHELAEIGAAYGKLRYPAAILLDDHDAKHGGKPLLGSAFLKDRGWTLAYDGYQKLFTKLS